jgi:pimeloyl-ACP methyl ester carboxylesterase
VALAAHGAPPLPADRRLRPAVDALSSTFRVITFPLCDEPSSDLEFDEGRGLACYVEQVRAALDHYRIDRAIVCGISFGGLIALGFAAAHADRTTALVLASTPGPGWHLRRRHEIYARMPPPFGPLFLAETPGRDPVRERFEQFGALDSLALRRLTAQDVGGRAAFSRGCRRARMVTTFDAAAACARISAPLIVTGEPALDHVVSVADSVKCVSLIRGARGVVLERTGHLGSITRPGNFAAIVRDFAGETDARRLSDRSVRLPPDHDRGASEVA